MNTPGIVRIGVTSSLLFGLFLFPITAEADSLGSDATVSITAKSGTWSVAPVASVGADAGPLAVSFPSPNGSVNRTQFLYMKNFGTLALTQMTVSATGWPSGGARTVVLYTCDGTWTTSGLTKGNCSDGTTGTSVGSISTNAPSTNVSVSLPEKDSTVHLKALIGSSANGVGLTFSTSVNRSQVRVAETTSS